MVDADAIFGGKEMLTVEIKNSQPIDLVDLTTSLMALAQDFQEYAARRIENPELANLKLYVREMRSGSIIADLIPYAQQADWLLDHRDLLGAFVGNLNDLASFFLSGAKTEEVPSRQGELSP